MGRAGAGLLSSRFSYVTDRTRRSMAKGIVEVTVRGSVVIFPVETR